MNLGEYLTSNGIAYADFANALKKHRASVTEQAVRNWVVGRGKNARKPSAKWWAAIEAATGGAVTMQDLRPEVFVAAPKTKRKRAA